MIELHGWLSIRETYENEDIFPSNEFESRRQRVEEIIRNNTCGIRLEYVNGEPFISSMFCFNHHSQEVDEIVDIYKRISEQATGSYGMIYLWDDEDKQYYNDFQVYVFKRGKCSFWLDKDLSPCIPVIEDQM